MNESGKKGGGMMTSPECGFRSGGLWPQRPYIVRTNGMLQKRTV